MINILYHACDIPDAVLSILAAMDGDPTVMWLYLRSATPIMAEDDTANLADVASIVAILHELAVNNATRNVVHVVLITDCFLNTREEERDAFMSQIAHIVSNEFSCVEAVGWRSRNTGAMIRGVDDWTIEDGTGADDQQHYFDHDVDEHFDYTDLESDDSRNESV
ncbi:hypothetical protein EUX98_g9631 [Antrodiella citrinella]|uniref:Uncharacterized protein n=1 Tax=Antrodiella citrinella TaxID=2447956 RepID=A0A4S4LPQ9_9APHY|nr:hypothetical protein EUX98_g9631 [Antrodiella citrinella]